MGANGWLCGRKGQPHAFVRPAGAACALLSAAVLRLADGCAATRPSRPSRPLQRSTSGSPSARLGPPWALWTSWSSGRSPTGCAAGCCICHGAHRQAAARCALRLCRGSFLHDGPPVRGRARQAGWWPHRRPPLPLPAPAPQLRYVMMAGKTDGPEDIAALIEFCRGKRSMQAIEVLPYHLLGVEVRRGGVVPGWWRRGCFDGQGANWTGSLAAGPALGYSSTHGLCWRASALRCCWSQLLPPLLCPCPPCRSGSRRGWSTP